MVKVLFEGSIFLHQNLGGISKYISKLNENLGSNNIKSKIFCPLTINNYLTKEKKNILFFFKFKKIPRFLRKFYFTINNILTIFYSLYYRPDVIHFSYYNNFLAKYLKIPYILTVYDLIHEKKNYKKNFFDKKKSIDKAKHIICISNKTKKDLIKIYKVNKKKVSVIYLGTENVKSKKIKKIYNDKYILFVGSRHRYKNFDNFIKAYSKSKFLKKNYNIVCFGGGNFKIDEIDLFKRLKIENQINLIEGEESLMQQYYRNASLFVTVSISEGFGLTPFEAMNNGCPVVCSNIEVFKENLQECCQFVNPLNLNSIKFGIENILQNKKKRQKLILKANKIVKNFTWKKTTSQTAEIYKKII